MDIKNNFLSVITLGSFNPAILTPDFLKDNGILSSIENPQGSITPVVSNLKFGNISFFAELERFQVIHHRIEDFQNSQIVEAAYKYIEVLKYTPLLVQGVNFNVNLIKYHDSSAIKTIFKDPLKGIANHIGKIDEYLADIRTKLIKGESETQAVNYKYYLDKGISIAINFTKINGEIVLNFNQEIENIKSDRNRIKIIYDNYQKIVQRFLALIESIQK